MYALSAIKDYRQEGKVNHRLSNIILLIVCGVLSGFDSWEGIRDFGVARTDFLSELGDFESGPPSADTIARVIGMINLKYMQVLSFDE
ncbi:transposase family protein [Vibrio parahaemolyticus]|nr:transposase family protein [Vibrio parahaemolyticus]EJI6683781.1 transposase family protein [Vibrio parahaemolyticus]EJL6386205.1 transposase family protein [Vibrio parahaemolyticus]MDB6194755.1 transposase family protein [Vibrio parahaemolyticus]HCG5917814.1 transposase family protein [Vibrio parahaemolyticus]